MFDGMKVEQVESLCQVVDIFIKPLGSEQHNLLCSRLCLFNVFHMSFEGDVENMLFSVTLNLKIIVG